ncbi:MAG TPA: sulfotransferase domain-containing protein [Nocardioidaceae bacterium]|nr:sulfotransferase domain-containing protein [Nocardioidaceae bacterium]
MSGRLPNLLVVGVPKAGTGSLFAYLTQHPDVCGADEKEVGYFNFFNPRRKQGAPPPLDAYRAHFAHCTGERYAVEATPTYSYGGRPVIDAIRATLPSVKVVISLRDPVQRLWSAYTFQRELGNEQRTFSAYLDACERRNRDGSDLVPRDHHHGLYIGYYADYVPLWLDAFEEDIRVVFADDLAGRPQAVVGDLLRWLDLDDSVPLDLSLRNRTHHPRSTRAARLAYSVKRAGDRWGLLPGSLRGRLRRMYLRANEGHPPEEMADDDRRRAEALYRESTEQTARALAAHGYTRLPGWLRAGAAA